MVAVEVEVKIGCEQIIVLPVAPMVCRYTYTVRVVKNLQNFSECVSVQQAMCSEYSVGGDNEIHESKADICFAMERNNEVITGWCYTFGDNRHNAYLSRIYASDYLHTEKSGKFQKDGSISGMENYPCNCPYFNISYSLSLCRSRYFPSRIHG